MTLDELKKLPPLTEEEKKTIRDAKPTPSEDCPAMTAEDLKEFRPWYAKSKKPVTINLDNGAILYFKNLAEETGISYQNLINLFLVQCAKEKKRPVFA
jgi:predicted DNA binding CopG/RHH family protein